MNTDGDDDDGMLRGRRVLPDDGVGDGSGMGQLGVACDDKLVGKAYDGVWRCGSGCKGTRGTEDEIGGNGRCGANCLGYEEDSGLMGGNDGNADVWSMGARASSVGGSAAAT